MEEKKLNEKESLELITQMITNTRNHILNHKAQRKHVQGA